MDERAPTPPPDTPPKQALAFREDYLLFGLLVREGLLDPGALDALAERQRAHVEPPPLAELLVEDGVLSPQQVRRVHEQIPLLAGSEITGRAGKEAEAISSTIPEDFASLDETSLTEDEVTLLKRTRVKGGVVGQVVEGHVVLDRIGGGGQGDVYLAKQLSLNRYVALKKLEVPHKASPEKFLNAFRREAQTLARINHARIVKVFEIFQRNGDAFFTMEYVSGRTLRELVGGEGNPLSVDVVANVACQACSALARTAEDGLVHRDIKPANMLIDENGDLKIVDFGLAGAAARFVERSSGFVGTPHFASPEQCRGEGLTPASDQYSLGVTLYYALTGKLPFSAKRLADLIEKQIDESPLPPSAVNEDLSKEVDRVILRMLEKNPERRFPAFDECFNAWERILHESAEEGAAGSQQLLGESLLRLGRKERRRLLHQGMVLAGLWAAMALGTILGESGLRRRHLHSALDAAGHWGSALLAFSLLCIFYVALARKKRLPVIGSLRGWLITHVATAIPAVILLLIHSGNFLRGITPGPPHAKPVLSIVLAGVLIVTAVSGSVGLLIFRELRRLHQFQRMNLRGAVSSPREEMLTILGARMLSGWRLVHYPLAVCFILLALLHIVVTLRFSVP